MRTSLGRRDSEPVLPSVNSSDHLPAKSQLWLIGFLILNILVFTAIIFLSTGSASLVLSWAKAHLDSLLMLYLAMVLTLVVGNMVTSRLKAVLVFWEWPEPWPINKAVSRYVPKEASPAGSGQPPIGAAAQRDLWNQIYRKHRSDPAVTEAATRFRLAQELAWLAFVILIFFGIGTLAVGHITAPTLAYSACLLFQYLCAAMAARTIGIRFFSDVLAIAQTHKIFAHTGESSDLDSR
jgi:hypothetical protein